MPFPTAALEQRALSWRGTVAPCMSVEAEFEHRLAIRRYYKVDSAGHANTGLEPGDIRGQLALVNTPDVPDWYPSRWQSFRKLLTDGLPGDLVHPDLGKLYARVKRFRYKLSPETSAGTIVEVDWTQSLRDVETATKFDDSKAGAAEAAKNADEAMEALGLPYPDGMASNDLFGSIQAVFDQATGFFIDINGSVNKLVAQIDEIQSALDSLVLAAYSTALSAAERDPIVNAVERWVLEDSLLQLRAILLQTVQDNTQGARATLSTTTSRAVDVATLAAELGADIGSLIDLNPSASASPLIPKGTQIKYFAA